MARNEHPRNAQATPLFQLNSVMASHTVTIGTSRTTIIEATDDVVENPYRARYATSRDAGAMDSVVREAFGESVPNSATARDMRRKHTTYIVVTKTDLDADLNGEDRTERFGGWNFRFKSIFSSSSHHHDASPRSRAVAGLVGIWTPADQAHIMVIASRPGERRQGVGELLIIATLCESMKSRADHATLEVRRSNEAAQSLYRKYGFRDIGIRRRYYSDNHEDAVIMATPSFTNLDYLRTLQRRCKGYFAVRGDAELQVDPWDYLVLPE